MRWSLGGFRPPVKPPAGRGRLRNMGQERSGGAVTVQRAAGELGGPMPTTEFAAATDAVVSNIEQVIEGKTATVRLALAVLLAEGHLLIEDVPGVGKTKLAKAL